MHPQSLIAGELTGVKLTVTNLRSATCRDIVISFSPPLTLVSGRLKSVGCRQLAPGEQWMAQIMLESLPSAPNPLTLPTRLRWEEGEQVKHAESEIVFAVLRKQRPPPLQPPPAPKKMLRVFLNYAREDEAKVERLYQKLADAGFRPWMAKRDILPGQRWQSSIRQAIQDADFVLICLSKHSAGKRGWVQREIRSALGIADGMLDSDVYLIPVRFTDCEVPEWLQNFQWVDLFEQDGWTRLAQSHADRDGTPNRIVGRFGKRRWHYELANAKALALI